MSEELTFKQGDEQWQKLRKLATTDLFWFASVVLNYGERVPMREHMHRALCLFVERRTGNVALDTARYRKIMMPRETGKSTLVTQARVIQMLCENRELSIMIANEKEQTARDFLFAIKTQFESNELLRALFPELIPPDLNATVWSASRIILNRESARKEPSIFVIGVGGTVTGLHPDRILIDDMISREAAENARAGSWQIMAQVNRWSNQLDMLLNKNDPNAEIIFIGTRWYFDDCYDYLDKAFGYGEQQIRYNLRLPLPDGSVQTIPAYRAGDLATFSRAGIEEGKAAFPEVWSMDRMARSRMRDEILFSANVMNNPNNEATATFKESWLKTHTWPDERNILYTDGAGKKCYVALTDLDVLFLVDPGGFSARRTEDRARPAVAVVGDDRAGMYHILNIYNEKDTFLAAIQQIVAWITQYSPRKIYTERAGQQAAFAQLLREEIKKAGLSTIVDDTTLKPGVTQKEVRILGLEPYFQRGQFTIGTSAAFHTFREQYTQFPRTARFDVLDVLAYLPRVVKPRAGLSSQRDTTARQDAERASYRARRGFG